MIRRRFISILVLLGLFAFNANADSLGRYLKEKVAGDVISVTEWNGLVAGLIDGVSDINVDNQVSSFCFAATGTEFFPSGTVLPLFIPPAGAAVTIEQIVVGVIGSGTVAFGLEERAMSSLDTPASTILGFVDNATIDQSMETILRASLTDSTLAVNRVMCATFTTNCVTGVVEYIFGQVYYNRVLSN